jgi:hypothetical protein
LGVRVGGLLAAAAAGTEPAAQELELELELF